MKTFVYKDMEDAERQIRNMPTEELKQLLGQGLQKEVGLNEELAALNGQLAVWDENRRQFHAVKQELATLDRDTHSLEAEQAKLRAELARRERVKIA